LARLDSVQSVARQVWDLRKKEIAYTLKGHTDTVSHHLAVVISKTSADQAPAFQIASLALSPNGHYLASYGFDSTLMIHDVRPWSADPTRVYRTLLVRGSLTPAEAS
jgi:Prp8 binding protein